MNERFKLVFKGEVRDGQHPAVVRKKLAALMKASDEQLAVLFSGKSVVVRKDVTADAVEKYRGAFEKAGALLHAMPMADTGDAISPEPSASEPSPPKPAEPIAAEVSQPPPEAPPASAGQPTAGAELQMAAVGTDLLTTGERPVVTTTAVETDHLSLAFPGTDLLDAVPEQPVAAPDTSHMSLDAVGATLGEVEPESAPPVPDVDFGLADVGADMGAAPKAEAPPAPDVSHLELADSEES